jgi:50S ribosome-binding GTPase
VWSNQRMRTPPDLRRSVADLVAALRPVAAGNGAEARLAGDAVDRLEAHSLARLDRPSAPLRVAVSGLTGVGKSALVNALAGSESCEVGVIRPTTTEPQVVELAATTEPSTLLEAITLVDLPPGPGDDLARSADLHLFVTSPARYADAEGWDHLTRLTSRAIPTWVVLSQVSDEDDVVVDDLRMRLQQAGLDIPLVTLPDISVPDAVAELSERLVAHAAASRAGAERDRIAALVGQADRVAVGLRRLGAADDVLLTAVDSAYGPVATAAVELAKPDGSVDRLDNAADRRWDEVVDRLALVLTQRIGAAAEAAATEWATDPEGSRLLEGDGVELWRHGASTTALARDQLLVWPGETEVLVTSRMRPRRWWQRPIPPAELTALVKRRALGGPDTLTRRERRRFDTTVDEVTDQARGLLGRLAVGVVDADKQRFVDRLRPVDPARIGEIERAADAVRQALEPAEVDGA